MIELPFGAPSEEAYWAAGQRVVGERGVPTTVVLPPGSRRG
jgi:hypothetical protein